MARLSPSAHKPILGFRMKLMSSAFPQAEVYCKSFSLPSFDNSPITIDYGNTQMKLKGKTKWNDIQLTLYQFENITIPEVWDWVTKHQNTDEGIDKYADEYKKDISLQLLKPDGFSVLHEFSLKGAFIGSAELGEFDWDSDDKTEMTITLSYDYAVKIK